MFYRPLILLSCTLSIACAQEALQLDKIEVQENFNTLEERKENSIAKRIIKGEELTQYGDLNALEVLKRTPGVTIPQGKGKKGAPGKGYTKVLIDGEEVSSSKRGNSLEQISPDMIERIEVMTNGSAEYTAEAMGGIVNIVLKKPKSQGQTLAKFTAGAYSDEPMGSLFIQNEGKAGKFSYLINATLADNSQADDASTHTDTSSGYRDELSWSEARYRSLGLTTKVIYSPSSKAKYTFDGSLNLNDYRKELTENRYSDGSTTPEIVRSDDKGEGMMVWSKLSGVHNISSTELLEWKLKFHQNTQEGENLSSLTTGDQLQYDKSTFRVFGTEGSYSVAADNHFIKTGVELKRLDQKEGVRVLENSIEISNDPTSLHENKGALYLQDEITLGDKAVITPGLRYENVSRDFGQTSRIDYLAPSLHFLYKLTPEDNLRASIAKTVKLPRLDELSSSVDSSLDQNDINHPDVMGNPNLTEEKALSYELRLEHYFEDKGIISIGGFYRAIDDKIEKLTTYDPTTLRYVERPYNAGEGKLWGLELELKKSLGTYVEGVGMFANATFQNSSLTTDGFTRPIKQTADYFYNIGVDHTLKAYRLTYGAAYRYVGGYDDPIDENGVSESQKGYGVLDLYATKRLNSTFKLGLNLKNLTASTITTTSQRTVSGVLNETQIDREHSQPQILLSLEGRW
ncbi:MAG: TonB-dependent receptor [Sulfuricurvum sp.]|nr:TonB-dependent receptor [Sulfuricurvum sp.]